MKRTLRSILRQFNIVVENHQHLLSKSSINEPFSSIFIAMWKITILIASHQNIHFYPLSAIIAPNIHHIAVFHENSFNNPYIPTISLYWWLLTHRFPLFRPSTKNSAAPRLRPAPRSTRSTAELRRAGSTVPAVPGAAARHLKFVAP